MSIRCRFNLHRWTAWAWTTFHRQLTRGFWQTKQVRRCKRCGGTEFRWLG